MNLFAPEYYHRFRCLAGACPDSCCKEWEVDVDADSAAYYRTLPGPLGKQLCRVLRDTDNGTVMTIENSRCPMCARTVCARFRHSLGTMHCVRSAENSPACAMIMAISQN